MNFIQALICDHCGNVWDGTLIAICPNCGKSGIQLNEINKYKIVCILARAIAQKERAREDLAVARENLTKVTEIKSRLYKVKQTIINLETLVFGDQIKTGMNQDGIVLKIQKHKGVIIFAQYPSGELYFTPAGHVKRNLFISNKQAKEFAIAHQEGIDD